MKPKWRGSVIAVASVTAFCAVFYGSADRNSGVSKVWLYVFFTTGFIGGVLAFIDSIRQMAAARRPPGMTKKSNERGHTGP